MALTKKQLEECEAKHAKKKKIVKKPRTLATKAEKATKVLAEKAVAKKKIVKKPTKAEKAKLAGSHKMPDGSIMKDKDMPKKKPVVDKNLLKNVMGVMADVAKDKGKSTKADIDSKVAKDKKAVKGKLTQTAFLEDVVLEDGYDGANDQDFEDRLEGLMYSAPHDMTETQQMKFFERQSNTAYRHSHMFQKALFKKLIKGKKFKSFKEASKVFISNINKYHPDLDI